MTNVLQGRRILVTRPAVQAAMLAEKIADAGGEPVLFPLLEIGPADDFSVLAEAILRLDDYAVVIFVSPNAVNYSLPRIVERRAWPPGLTAAVIGPGTVAQLARHGVDNAIAPTARFDSEGVLELPAFQAARVAGKRILILRGNGGRELLTETLRQRGAEVDCVTCYHRSAPADGEAVVSRLRNNALDALTISSSEGLRNLLALLDTEAIERLRRLPLFVPHRRIAEVAAELGLANVVLTGPADAGIVESLCSYPWPRHERRS
ncbi:MAG: uroporphyrinogen-III synthase [Propionivibrio sp.]